ncbi:MAG: hypothetical protein WAN46_11835 [Gammaproteobacteria bacterium]|jgi:tRNA (cmo5U34)-methyltransferase
MAEAKKDALFADKRNLIEDFDFGAKTAEVFDDMLDRSVPLYTDIQRMMGELATDFGVAGTSLYDLGCSTGTTMVHFQSAGYKPSSLDGIGFSEGSFKGRA